MDNIYAIVVIYNGMRNNWIQKCFDSLQRSSVDVTIIAVDNNSSDGSLIFIKRNYPDIILLESKENLGFGGANNLALKEALARGGEYFFLLNQDARVDSDTVEKLIDVFQRNAGFAVVSPVHLDGQGEALDYNFSNYIIPEKCKDFYSDSVLGKYNKEIYETQFVCAAAWLLSKETLRVLGGFNPLFYHYAEDNNYCDRALFFGLRIGIVPSVYIYHDRRLRENFNITNNIEYRKRKYLQYCSDPCVRLDLFEEKKQLYKRLWLSKLTFRLQQFNEVSWKIALLKEKKTLIMEMNRVQSSTQEFKFLK